MSIAHCPTPLAPAVLEDYWLADLSPSEEAAAEQHLLACDECSRRLRDVIGLAEGVRAVAWGGTLRVVVTDAFLNRLAQEGLHVREYRVTPGGSVACTVTAEDDLVVGRFVAPLGGVGAVGRAARRQGRCAGGGGELNPKRLKSLQINRSA